MESIIIAIIMWGGACLLIWIMCKSLREIKWTSKKVVYLLEIQNRKNGMNVRMVCDSMDKATAYARDCVGNDSRRDYAIRITELMLNVERIDYDKAE